MKNLLAIAVGFFAVTAFGPQVLLWLLAAAVVYDVWKRGKRI